MAVCTLAPYAFNQFFDHNGNPLALGKLYTYLAGTLTPLATSTDVSGTPSHENPIELDSAGRCAAIFLGPSSYKFVLKDADAVTIDTIDNIAAHHLHTGVEVFPAGLYSGNGGVNMATATATALFTITAGVTTRYEVSAAVSALGSAGYTAAATVLSDGVDARIIALNGSNLTLTLSGLNVRATQTSGTTQLVNFHYVRYG